MVDLTALLDREALDLALLIPCEVDSLVEARRFGADADTSGEAGAARDDRRGIVDKYVL